MKIIAELDYSSIRDPTQLGSLGNFLIYHISKQHLVIMCTNFQTWGICKGGLGQLHSVIQIHFSPCYVLDSMVMFNCKSSSLAVNVLKFLTVP